MPPLPSIETTLTVPEIRARLDQAARRGRMPGYVDRDPPPGLAFEIVDFGHPFEGVLEARPETPGHLSFSARMQTRLPIIFAIVIVLSAWPGVYFLESLLAFIPGYASWIWAGWWYIPLTLISGAWAFKGSLAKSRASIHEGAVEAITKIGNELKA